VYTFELDKDAKAADKLKEKIAALPNPAVRPGPIIAPLPLLPAVPAPLPAVRPNPAQQLQEALDRIEKLEKRIAELEKAKGGEPKKEEPKKDDKK
jgi:hypothetical protein